MTLIGWVAAAVIGIGLGLLLGLSRTAYGYSMTSFEVTGVPPITFVPDELLDVARMLRLSRRDTIRKIVLSSAMPAVVVGLRLALSLCLVLTVVAEMIGHPAGLGHALVRARLAIQPDQVFACGADIRRAAARPGVSRMVRGSGRGPTSQWPVPAPRIVVRSGWQT